MAERMWYSYALIFIQIHSFDVGKYQFLLVTILCSIQQDWKFQYIWDKK